MVSRGEGSDEYLIKDVSWSCINGEETMQACITLRYVRVC